MFLGVGSNSWDGSLSPRLHSASRSAGNVLVRAAALPSQAPGAGMPWHPAPEGSVLAHTSLVQTLGTPPRHHPQTVPQAHALGARPA